MSTGQHEQPGRVSRCLPVVAAMMLLASVVFAAPGSEPAAAQSPPIDWELPPAAYRVDIPDWYETSRVHVHSRWNIQRCFAKLCSLESNPDGFWGFASEAERWGSTVLTRWMKGQDEEAWWDSAVGISHPTVATEGDIPKRLIDDATSRGIYSVAYYRHTEDAWVTANRPSWNALDVNGDKVTNASYGNWHSFSSPYGDYVMTRLEELIEKGAKGIYFDYSHIPGGGDYHPDAVARYTELYGGTPYGQSSSRLTQWRQELLRDFFSRAQETITAVDPEAMVIGSANSVTLDVLRDSVDVPKYEQGFERFLGGRRAGSVLLLDSTGGWPHLWTVPETEDTDAVMADYVAYGTIYNRDIREFEAPNVPETIRASYGRAFDLSLDVSEAMIDVQPYRHARILVNGSFVVDKVTSLNSTVASAFDSLDARNVPVGFATWSQMIESGADPNSAIIIDPINSRSYYSTGSGLRAQVWQSIQAFEAAGGTALFSGDMTSGWQNRIAAGDLPVSLEGGGASNGFVPYVSNDGTKLVVNVSNSDVAGLKIHLSDSTFGQPVEATESVTGTSPAITAVAGGWTVDVPRASMMSQVVIDFAEADTTTVGDVNCSEVVDAADIAAILEYVVSLRAAVTSCPLTDVDGELHVGAGDVDADEDADLVDAWMMAVCAADGQNSFCPPPPTGG